VQSECFPAAYGGGGNMLVAAPTGSGKTGVLELALLRLLLSRRGAGVGGGGGGGGAVKAVYLGPTRALVQERHRDWAARFGPAGAAGLGLRCLELSGARFLPP